LIVHLTVSDVDLADTTDGAPLGARVGFVVGRQVGGAVVRNRVRRQLQHLSAARLAKLPPSARLVVRALPAAAGSSSPDLGADLDAAIARGLAGVHRSRAETR
jgi:ribonuclease P protein component